MNPDMLRDLLTRVQELDRRHVAYRQGVVTATSPLAVALGGSSTSNASLRALSTYVPLVGDVVGVLTFDHDVIVLGAIGTKRMTYGVSPAFNWSGGIHTTVTVTHGLGVTPVAVIPSSARPGDALADDARAPWLVTVTNKTTTTFDLIFSTKNNGTIGVFGVAAGACDWVAYS